MIERITPEELNLFLLLSNPVSCAEILFTDFENTNIQTDEVKLAKLRTYQLPMLSYEYMLYDNPKLSKRENFELRKGAGTIYSVAARKIGKCEFEENLCLLSNGQRIKFKDLINTTQEIVSLNQDTWKLEKSVATFLDNGIKDCFRITLNSGKKITVTEKHPLLTDSGWIEVNNLSVGNFIATPRKYPFLGTKRVDENVAKLLGYLIGDGGCSQSTIRFTGIESEIISEITELADYFDCSLRKDGIDYNFRNKNGRQYLENGHCAKNKVQELVLQYNINCLAKEKRIPEQCFSWSNKYISLLLNRLFACDGYVNEKYISICLASKGLIEDIQHLLLRFGITSTIYEKKKICGDRVFDAWELHIGRYDNCYSFIKRIGVKTKEKNFKIKKNLISSYGDYIPNSFYYTLEKYFNGFRERFGTKELKNYNFSRQKLQRIAEAVQSDEVDKVAYSDIFWEKIELIEKLHNLPTVAVTVNGNENYISNDIISHNTVCVEILDICQSALMLPGEEVIFTSCDALHIRPILDKVLNIFTNNFFIKHFVHRTVKSPNYKIEMKNGYVLESVNQNYTSRNPGNSFFGHHAKRIYIEEISTEIEEVYKKRIEAVSDFGAVIRASGMTNYTNHSPLGLLINAPENKNFINNVPIYVNHEWNEKTKAAAIREHGGEESITYKMFCLGEIVQDGINVIDMERVRNNYMPNKDVKTFEITKKLFPLFTEILVFDKPRGVDEVWIAVDYGEIASSEIVILFKVGDVFQYHYNITLVSLIEDEQFQILRFIAAFFNANMISIDVTDGGGRALFRALEKYYGNRNNLEWVAFTEKLVIDYERDEKGKIRFDKDGKMIPKEEYVSEWSVKELKTLLYEAILKVPFQHKLDQQLNSLIAVPSASGRVVYETMQTEDHVLAAFRTFSIAYFNNKFKQLKPVGNKKFSKEGV